MNAWALGLPAVRLVALTLGLLRSIRVMPVIGTEIMRAAFALAFLIATTATAAAQTGPVIVIPGRPGVPIMINGVDASYAVVEGDWGLAKGQRVGPTVYGGHLVDYEAHVGHYYPSSGHLPGYGRLEIEPPSDGRPQRAQSYHQSWSVQSSQQPAAPFDPQQGGAMPQNQGSAVPQNQGGVAQQNPGGFAPQNHEAGQQNLEHPPQNFEHPQQSLEHPQPLEHPPQNFQYRKPRRHPR
jgi:hypothetical protein